MRKLLVVFTIMECCISVPAKAQTWDLVRAGFIGDLHTICFVGADTGYAASNDALLRTTNAGQAWTQHQITSKIPEGISTIAFPSSRVGYAGGLHVYKTTDAGETWDSIAKINALSSWFFNDSMGYVVGGSKGYTSDGGRTWTVVTTAPQVGEATFFVNEQLGFIGGWTSQVFGIMGQVAITSNGGEQWDLLDSLAIALRVYKFEIHAIHFVNENFGWIGGKRYWASKPYPFSNIRAMYTTDGGEMWDTIPYVFPNTINCIEFINERIGFIGDEKGWIFATTDGGMSWSCDSLSGLGMSINDFCVVGGTTVYAVGNSSLMLRTTLPTSISDVKDSSSLRLYPNPTYGTFKIALPYADNVFVEHYIKIVDEKGSVVFEETSRMNNIDVDLSHLACGVYYVAATNGAHRFTAKVVLVY